MIRRDDIKIPTLVSEILENLYIWPQGVNYLGTPQYIKIDPFRQNVINDYKNYLEKRKKKYKESKLSSK